MSDIRIGDGWVQLPTTMQGWVQIRGALVDPEKVEIITMTDGHAVPVSDRAIRKASETHAQIHGGQDGVES